LETWRDNVEELQRGETVVELRKTGIDVIGDVPWGTHFCHFYQSKQDLIEILVPYFKAGLKNNEYCMWVTAEPLMAEEARQALSGAVPRFFSHLKKGQIDILPYTEWHMKSGSSNARGVMNGWLKRLESALDKGCTGLRLAENTFWLERRQWKRFVNHEAEVNTIIGNHKILAMCSYSLKKCSATDVMDVIGTHEFALIKQEGKWEIFQSSSHKATKRALVESQAEIAHLASFPELNPNPVLEVDVAGNIKYLSPAAKKRFRSLSTKGKEHPFLANWESLADKIRSERLFFLSRDVNVGKSWYEQVVYYVPSTERFRIYAREVTERKKMVEARRKAREELEALVQKRTEELREANRMLQAEIAERKRAEEAVNAERQQFNDVLEMLPAYLVLLTPDYHVPFANRFFRERFGESHGRRCFEYLFGRTEPCEICETYKVLKTMTPGEWEWTGPDNHNYYVYDFPFIDTDGSTLIMEMGIDITEQKQAQAALRKARDELEIRVQERTKDLEESEMRYRSLFEKSPYGILIVNSDSLRIIESNNKAAAQLGYSRYEFAQLTIGDIEAVETREQTALHAQRMLELGEDHFVTRHRSKTGEIRDVEVTTKVIELPGKSVILVMLNDITERKKAEEALKESQQDLNRAQAVARTGSWRLDVRRNELLWSDETYRMFGIPKGAPLTYEMFLSIVHPEDRDLVDRTWTAALKGEPYDIDHRIVVGTEAKWVREKAELEVDEHGVVKGGFGTVQDITERKQAEEALQHITAELARSNAELEQFAYVASHDLQEPLRMVSSYVQLIADRYKGKLDQDADDFIRYAYDGALRMQRLINDLLAYARVGTRGGTFEQVNLEAVLVQALSNLEVAINENNAIITHDSLPVIWGDAGQLIQLFQNLIDNAIKFHGEEAPRIHVSSGLRGSEWVLSVRDNGVGIAPEYFDRIFLLFQRLHPREKYPGTGIGLAICKRIVERHGGLIWVESKPDGGSTFCFSLPASLPRSEKWLESGLRQ
jgi:PAS domain S-box-containing protein